MTEKQKILIVDDKKENLVALRQVLGDLDAEVVEATSGNKALAATLEHDFAVAILDVMMPGMDGYELAGYLRGDKKTRHIPIVFVTAATAYEQYMFKGYEAGAIDYIIKPYTPEIMVSKVNVLLEMDRNRRELQLTAEILKKSEERLGLAMDAGKHGTWDWNIGTGETFFDERYYRMAGYENNEFPQTFDAWAAHVHPEDLPGAESAIRTYHSGESDHYDVEFRWMQRDGSWMWIQAKGKIVDRDESGAPVRMIGTHTDITANKEAEKQVQKENAKLSAMISGMDEGVVFADADNRIIEVNEYFCKFIKTPREKILGKTIESLHQGNVLEHINKLIEKFRQNPDSAPFIMQRQLGGADVILRMQPIYRENHYDGVLLNVVDVTELVEARRESEAAKKEALEANQAKSEFLANMSHEIRTPMNGVIGMTGLLLETELTPAQQHYSQTIQSSADSLLSLINDILDFSKFEAGHLEMENIDFNLSHLLEDFAVPLAVRTKEKGLELVCLPDPDVPELLQGDPSRLRQVLNNLAGNAVKFTDDGEIQVRASLVSQTDTQARILFSIRDTGIGIPQDKFDFLFNKFTQSDSSTSRRFGGTGLGLAISKHLAEMMQGEIGVQSKEGEGSRFWFTALFDLQHGQEESARFLPGELRGMNILVVDDNSTNLEVLSRQLKSWDVQPVEAREGETALQKLQAACDSGNTPGMIVTDMCMPGMDGSELCRKIKADERFQDIPLVVLTSTGRPGDARRCAEQGFNAYLNKPVRKSELFDTLVTVLSRAQQPSDTSPIVTLHSAREQKRRSTENSRLSGHVLVAEDNTINQELACATLENMGLTTEVASNGLEAVEAVKNNSFDLVFMDVQMPEMDGFEATRAIRKEEKGERKKIPIIAMTAHAMEEDREKCIRAGMDDYISKPVEPEILAKLLRDYLQDTAFAQEETSHQQHDSREKTADAVPEKGEIFKEAELFKRTGENRELMQKMLQKVLEGLPNYLQDLKTAAENGNARDVKFYAHSFKGMAGNFAAPRVQEIAAKLESMGVNQDLSGIEALIFELENEIELLKTELKKYLKE